MTLRYFNVFGPRQDPGSPYSAVIPLFITALLAGRPPVVYGDGRQSRDFTFVANVVQANLLAADAPDAAGRVLNAANGRSISLLELLAAINDLLGTKVVPPLRAAPSGRHPRKHGRHHARPHAAAVRAAGRLPRGPAAINRLLPPPGAGAEVIIHGCTLARLCKRGFSARRVSEGPEPITLAYASG